MQRIISASQLNGPYHIFYENTLSAQFQLIHNHATDVRRAQNELPVIDGSRGMMSPPARHVRETCTSLAAGVTESMPQHFDLLRPFRHRRRRWFRTNSPNHTET